VPGDADLSQTLDELERKLRDLERELGTPPPTPPPAPAPSMGAGLGDLAAEIDELSRFRDQLQKIGRELEEEYERVLERLGTERPAPAPMPVDEPRPAPAVETVTLDAGPFADLDALAAFEQALDALEGVEAVQITGFEGRRALGELRLRGELGLPGASVHRDGDRLVVELGTED